MITETTRKVRFIGGSLDQARWRGGSDPRYFLSPGGIYEVFMIRVSDMYTSIRLAQYPKESFNSVMFEAVESSEVQPAAERR